MYRFLILLTFLPIITSYAQINELGIFIGGSNYIGDLGPTTYIAPNSPAIGIIYKLDKSPRHSWRLSYIQSTITSKDSNSEEINRKQRGLSFKNSIHEFSGGIEFNFFKFNLLTLSEEIKFTPYVFTGLNMTLYDNLYFNENKMQSSSKEKTIALPIILGIKSNISTNFVLGIEIGARYAFTDNLDGSLPSNKALGAIKFGNLNNSDWYVFSGITITYLFGNKPCFCGG